MNASMFWENAHSLPINEIRKSCPSIFRMFWIPSTRTVWNIQRSNNSNLVLAWIKSFSVVLLNVLCTSEILILWYVLARRMKKAGILSVQFVQWYCSKQLTRNYFWVYITLTLPTPPPKKICSMLYLLLNDGLINLNESIDTSTQNY